VSDYFRADLAKVHHRGFGFHADRCAPGILRLLARVRDRGGLVAELGAGSGLLTRYLVDAGHRVIATDASPDMLALAREHAPGTEDTRVLVLPDDPIPPADAVVSVGHVLSYLPDEDAVRRALVAAARAVRPGGVLALDLCDLSYADERRDAQPYARVTDHWAIVTRFAAPAPDRFVREITTFVRDGAGRDWRRDDERHENVLVDTAWAVALLADHGVDATASPSFGADTDAERLPPGLHAIVGLRRG